MSRNTESIKAILNRRFPQNLFVRRPLMGILLLISILFLFVVIYKPHQVQAAHRYSLQLTMLLYCAVITVPVTGISLALKYAPCFPKAEKWRLSHELLSLLIILIVIGLSVYFAGFLIEEPKSRWDLSTFLDSVIRSLLVSLLPVLLPTLLNMRYLLTPEISQHYSNSMPHDLQEDAVNLITISSKAKREELSFYPQQLIYAESQGNYVHFYLTGSNKPNRVIIRNAISNIEQQLIPNRCFMRVHRAFIVNLEHVESKRGNTLGYQLRLKDCNREFPVSRQNVKIFDAQMSRSHLSTHQ